MTGLPTSAGRLERTTFGLLLFQCMLEAIPHVTALDKLTFFPLLACVMALGYSRRATMQKPGPMVAAVLALSLFLVVASVLGPYPGESLNAWRKDYLPPLTVFFALLLTLNSRQRLVAVLLAVVAGVALRLALIAVELWVLHRPLIGSSAGFVHPYTQAIVPSSFYGGFVLNAAIYSPFVAAALLRKDLPRWGRLMTWFALIGSTVMVIDYGSRTPLVTLCVGMAVVLIAPLKGRPVIVLVVAVLGMVAFLHWQKPELASRYESIFSGQTYSNGTPGQGVTLGDRFRIWKGIVEMGNRHPLIGYGYGWKKLSIVVRNEGFLDRWRQTTPDDAFTLYYFSRGYGGINPHNLAVHLYFEGGMLGIALFAVMLAVFGLGCWRLYRRPGDDKALGILGGGFLAAWMVANVGNSIWAGEKLPFVVMALVAVALSSAWSTDRSSADRPVAMESTAA